MEHSLQKKTLTKAENCLKQTVSLLPKNTSLLTLTNLLINMSELWTKIESESEVHVVTLNSLLSDLESYFKSTSAIDSDIISKISLDILKTIRMAIGEDSVLIDKLCVTGPTEKLKSISRLLAKEEPLWIYCNLEAEKNSIFSYKINSFFITRLWYKKSEINWLWTPYKPPTDAWQPVSELKVKEGSWKGQKPAAKNIAFINWLSAFNPCEPLESIDQHLYKKSF